MENTQKSYKSNDKSSNKIPSKMKVQAQATKQEPIALSAKSSEGRLSSALNERAPKLIESAVEYLETNWNLRKIEKVATAFGIGSAADLRKLAGTANWGAIKRKISARPAQAAALVVAGVGMVILARQLIMDQNNSAPVKGDSKARH